MKPDEASQAKLKFHKKYLTPLKYIVIVIYIVIIPYLETPPWCID